MAFVCINKLTNHASIISKGLPHDGNPPQVIKRVKAYFYNGSDQMIHRCIMIFPRFHNQEKIEEIRNIYDPLHEHVAPHITLVFPFKSSLHIRSLEAHIRKSVRNIKPFKLTLQGITKEEGNYLFLNITEGEESILELHKQLYSNLLSEYYPDFLRITKYKPHLTLGRTRDTNQLEEAFNFCKGLREVFSEIIKEVTVEIIDENENSEIEITVELN